LDLDIEAGANAVSGVLIGVSLDDGEATKRPSANRPIFGVFTSGRGMRNHLIVKTTPAVRRARHLVAGPGRRDLSTTGEEDTTMTKLALMTCLSFATFQGLAMCIPDPPEIGDIGPDALIDDRRYRSRWPVSAR
jgi:hypothetical protein